MRRRRGGGKEKAHLAVAALARLDHVIAALVTLWLPWPVRVAPARLTPALAAARRARHQRHEQEQDRPKAHHHNEVDELANVVGRRL